MKDPAFLFYSSDFLSGTMFLSDEQVGQYIRLLCAQHQRGRLSEKHMLSICKAYDKDVFEKFTKDEDGNYYNERLELEVTKRLNYSNSRRNNALSVKKQPEAYAQHMGDRNRNENKDIIEPKVKNTFIPDISILDEFWKTQFTRWVEYRKEIKKPFTSQSQIDAQIKMLIKLSGGQGEAAEAIIDQSIGNRWQGLFEIKQKSTNLTINNNGKPKPASAEDVANVMYKYFGNGE